MAPNSKYRGGSTPSSIDHQNKRAERWVRQAAALRANLRRRKESQQARADQKASDSPGRTKSPSQD